MEVYAPNSGRGKFFQAFLQKVEDLAEGCVIVMGDFNSIMNEVVVVVGGGGCICLLFIVFLYIL